MSGFIDQLISGFIDRLINYTLPLWVALGLLVFVAIVWVAWPIRPRGEK